MKKSLFLFLILMVNGFTCVRAQQSDTNYYLKYATPFFDLLPGQFPERVNEEQFGRDSETVVQHAHGKQLEVVSTYHTFGERPDSNISRMKYTFNRDGRVVQFREDTKEWQYNYAGTRYAGAVYTNGIWWDTIRVGYNRSGLVSGYTHRSFSLKENENYSPEFLYDNNGRLVVARNIAYNQAAPNKEWRYGTFTYAYDKKGRIIRRQFLNSDGTLICTDSIAYGFADTEQMLLLTQQYFQMAGSGKWNLMGEIWYSKNSGNEVRSVAYRTLVANNGDRVAPGEVDKQYDAKERWQSSTDFDSLKRPVQKRTFGFSENADTLTVYNIESIDGHPQERMIYRLVNVYRADGLYAYSVFDSYEEKKEGKIKQNVLVNRLVDTYHWQ